MPETRLTRGVLTTTEDVHAADPSPADSPRRDAPEGVSRASRGFSGRSGHADEYSFPAAEWHRQGPASCQRGHSTATRRADGVGRPDLADTAGQMGPVARAEGPRTTTEGAPTAQDSLVTAARAAGDERVSEIIPNGRPLNSAFRRKLQNQSRSTALKLLEYSPSTAPYC